MYVFEQNNALVLTVHEQCDRASGLEMKCDYFHIPCNVQWYRAR